MSAYNTVVYSTKCQYCNNEIDAEIQFKYGDCWMSIYKVGEQLLWGGNDYGRKIMNGTVVVDGASDDCPHCGRETDYYVLIENNIIDKVMIADNSFDFIKAGENFIILPDFSPKE